MDGHRGKQVYNFPPRESPFATENTKVEPPPPVKGQRGSQVSFGGPEMITPAEIYYNQVAAVQKHQKAFEDSFFPKTEDALLRELDTESDAERFAQLLGSVSGAHDHEILDKLAALGIGTDTLAALSLFSRVPTRV